MATKKAAAPAAEITVKMKLRMLNRIQHIDSEIDEIERIKGELPEAIRNEEDTIEGLRTRINTVSEDIAALNKEILTDKGKNEEIKDAIKKYESQKDSVTNDRQLISLEREIEACGLDISLKEKHIKECNAKIKEKKKLIEEINEDIKGHEKDLEEKQEELHVIENEKAEDMKCYQAELDKLCEEFPDKRLLNAYTRIRSNVRNGLAVVPVVRDACGGCFNHIPPQRRIDIMDAKKLIVCEYCGRILVSDSIDEEAEDSPAK